MPTLVSTIETQARLRLIEPTARFWSSAELVEIISAGVKDLWRDIVDLKQEHFLTINGTDVYQGANAATLSGVPTDVHKVYIIEARDLTTNGSNAGLQFKPLDYNADSFQMARSRAAIDPVNDTIYYAITAQGAPVNAPVIYVAPKVTSQVNLSFCYVPTLGKLEAGSVIPIPGECDNAMIAWTVAFARAKEREDRAPDPSWLSIFATEKQHLLQSLGLRQLQEPSYADAMFAQYWG
jgi:hypothetical protein